MGWDRGAFVAFTAVHVLACGRHSASRYATRGRRHYNVRRTYLPVRAV